MSRKFRATALAAATTLVLTIGCSGGAVPGTSAKTSQPTRQQAPSAPTPRPKPPVASTVAQSGVAANATVQDAAGEAFELAALWEGSAAVLYFYRGNWCAYCKVQLAELQEDLPTFVAAGVNVVGISTDSTRGLEKTRTELSVTFPLYSDPSRSAIKAWGVLDKRNNIAKPSTFIIGPGGEVLFHHTGERPDADKVLMMLGLHATASTTPADRDQR